MLAIFTCQCVTGELKSRRVLKDAEVKDYLGVKVYVGKSHCNMGIDLLPKAVQETLECRAMRSCIEQSAGYSIIAGWDDHQMRWSDVYSGKIEDIVPAKKIAQAFAKNP